MHPRHPLEAASSSQCDRHGDCPRKAVVMWLKDVELVLHACHKICAADDSDLDDESCMMLLCNHMNHIGPRPFIENPKTFFNLGVMYGRQDFFTASM